MTRSEAVWFALAMGILLGVVETLWLSYAVRQWKKQAPERAEKKVAKLARQRAAKIQSLEDAVADEQANVNWIEMFTGPPHYGPPSRLRIAKARLAKLEGELHSIRGTS